MHKLLCILSFISSQTCGVITKTVAQGGGVITYIEELPQHTRKVTRTLTARDVTFIGILRDKEGRSYYLNGGDSWKLFDELHERYPKER